MADSLADQVVVGGAVLVTPADVIPAVFAIDRVVVTHAMSRSSASS
ncbi:hypothetical protein [Streptosporangium longisporum]